MVRADVPCEAIGVPFGSRCSHAAHLVTTTGTSTGYYHAVIVTVGKSPTMSACPSRRDGRPPPQKGRWRFKVFGGAAVWSPTSEKVRLLLSPTGEKWTICDSIAKVSAFGGTEVPEELCAALEANFAARSGRALGGRGAEAKG